MDEDVMRTAAMLGFHAAFERWTAKRDIGADAVEAFPSLAEVLWWSCTLDEHMRDSDESYDARRDADADGRVLRGLRWARNHINHALALVQADEPPFTLGVSRLGVARLGAIELMWAESASIPMGSRPDRVGRASYERHLQGRAVVHSLESARSWLHRSGIFRAWDDLD